MTTSTSSSQLNNLLTTSQPSGALKSSLRASASMPRGTLKVYVLKELPTGGFSVVSNNPAAAPNTSTNPKESKESKENKEK